MSKKKTNPEEQQDQAVKAAPKKKMSKKEKRAIAEQHAKEMNQKKMRNYGVGFVLSLISVIISFFFKPEAGTAMWSYTQIGCYVLMGVAGLFLKNGAKYELHPKRAKNMDMIGLAFIAICGGMIVAELFALFMG